MSNEIKTLIITVDFSTGIEMENSLNKAIDELAYILKKKGLIDMILEGKDFASLSTIYIQQKLKVKYEK